MTELEITVLVYLISVLVLAAAVLVGIKKR